MTAINYPASIYLHHYKSQKESRCQTILRATITEVPIPLREIGAYLRTSPKARKISTGSAPQNPAKVRKIYRHLSPNSRKKLSSCANNENIRALLGYIRKKRQTENSNELSGRRRRSYPKKSKRSSKRSRKSRRKKDRSLLEPNRMLPKMPVPNSV